MTKLKPFVSIELACDCHNVSVYPNEIQNGIILRTEELDKSKSYDTYLTPAEARELCNIIEMQLKRLGL